MKKYIDNDTIGKNLTSWVAITALCLELRKSVLKKQHQELTDEELTRLVFHEAVANKEKKWEYRKS